MKNIIFIIVLTGFCLTVFAQKTPGSFQKHKHVFERIQHTKLQYAKSQATPACLMDSMIVVNWDTINNLWINSNRVLYTYNAQSNLSTETDYNINASLTSWEKNSKSVLTYNSQNTLTLTLLYQWGVSSSTWFVAKRTTYTYSPANDLLVQLEELRDTISHSWVGDFRTTYTYNATHSVTMEIGEYFYSNTWKNAYKSTSTYNANSNLTNNTFYLWQITNWDPSDQTVYTYVSGNNPSSGVESQWNTNTSTWDNNKKYIYTFSGNNLTNELDQVWDTGTSSWQNSGNFTFTYNLNNNQTSELDQVWNTGTNTWRNVSKELMYYTCESSVGLSKLSGSTNKFVLYPNPASSEIYVDTEMDFTSICIQTINGQEVYNSKQSSKIVSLSQLEKGIYFIQLLDKNKNILTSKKFAKE